jgi:hypothetical protein
MPTLYVLASFVSTKILLTESGKGEKDSQNHTMMFLPTVFANLNTALDVQQTWPRLLHQWPVL